MVKDKKDEVKHQMYTTSIIVTADSESRVVETIHVINKPGQEPQTRVASSVNEALQLAGEINDEVSFNDVTSNVKRLPFIFRFSCSTSALSSRSARWR